ncbi:MAG: nucleotidyltransferase domain-containing protein [Candidatus Pacebacteria bacterium]|nr:nucleotidyltransferase domain-containing protein [Candidatus Paceibacterota bacterium]MDD3808000.1 nucleotidyltransferase domain-containing protein [Candidatus Paceibacterota bacterium]
MDKKDIKKLQQIFKKYPKVKLVYFFGSRNRGSFNKESDYDFAAYIKEEDNIEMFDLRLKLMDEISKILKNDNIEVVILNDLDNPTLKFEIIKEGSLIYSVEPYKITLEPQILNEYTDFILTFRRN